MTSLTYSQITKDCESIVKTEDDSKVQFRARKLTPNFTFSKVINKFSKDTTYVVSVLYNYNLENQSAKGCTVFFKDGSIISFPSEEVDIFPVSDGDILYSCVLLLKPKLFNKFSLSEVYKIELHNFKISISQSDWNKIKAFANCFIRL
jgi:hypothetical protein